MTTSELTGGSGTLMKKRLPHILSFSSNENKLQWWDKSALLASVADSSE